VVAGGLALGGAAAASVAGAGLAAAASGARVHAAATGAMLRVASQAPLSQVTAGQARDAALGTWTGEWTNDISGGSGTLTVRITNAEGGELSGTGTAAGGKCDREFSLSGWYRGSLVEMTIEMPDAGAGCPAASVSISMRMGRQGEMIIGVGHWSSRMEGRAAGKDLGFLELTKQ
jgi:hypothetical protein